MATIQSKISRGHKYWYIVESRRVNGKPRPVVLAYLGKADDLLKRLNGLTQNVKLKSYSHGGVCSLLDIASKLDIVSILNKHVQSSRPYMSEKPIRNNLTAGITYLLAAMGRICMPTSKMGWLNWAKTTSLEYMLRCSLSKVDSQHFWDLMDCFPEEAIEKAEQEILKKLFEVYNISTDTLFYDTTNFFTYIDTTNERCDIAERGRNKQKRSDLRQVGLAMVVTKEDHIPLSHHSYCGNLSDSVVFREVIVKIKTRMLTLGMNIDLHTLVFDRGNNSKKNMGVVKDLSLYYVGALTPYHHQSLVERSTENLTTIQVNDSPLNVYREKLEIWNEERTVLVFISDKLKAGQLRGVYQALAKKEKQLKNLQESLSNPKGKKRERKKLEDQIGVIVKGQFLKDLIQWRLDQISEGQFQLHFEIDNNKIYELEEDLGFRIIMTNRHDWKSSEIIKAYYGQSKIEHAFRNLKNPFHLALKPQYHWTDQKIKVHYFICIIGYLLSSVIYHELRHKTNYKGSLDKLLDSLNNVRLATIIEDSNNPGKSKAVYKLEEMSKEEKEIIECLNLENSHMNRPKINDVGVYK